MTGLAEGRARRLSLAVGWWLWWQVTVGSPAPGRDGKWRQARRLENFQERRARLPGFALAWWLLAQATLGSLWLSRFSVAGRVRVLGRGLWVIDGVLALWWLALPVGAAVALVLMSLGKAGPALQGAQGFALGLLSMLALGVLFLIVDSTLRL